jgi:hypothetical protein
MRYLLLMICSALLLGGCNNVTVDSGPNLVIKFHFDPDQLRLDNFGEPAEIPADHAAQTPNFRSISAHYIELAPSQFTLLGEGEIIYQGKETSNGGAPAVNFDKAIVSGDNEIFLAIPLSQIKNDSYEWVRVSLTYQNFDIVLDAKINDVELTDIPATAGSFVGFNTYISTFTIKNITLHVNSNKLQGYVGIETPYGTSEFQSPVGATTVPNPLFDTSPIEPGSCVVTGEFEEALIITGEETEDITLTLSVSVNKSFEWEDHNSNGRFEPLLDENVVDMGLRGLIPTVEYN